MMRVKKSDTQFNTTNEKECENYCNRDCNNCQAYAYVEAETRADTAICMIWEENLNDIQAAYLDGGHDLYVRVAVSDIGKLLFQCVVNATLKYICMHSFSFYFTFAKGVPIWETGG